jgi:CRISPR-associated endonuclease Csn1
MVASGCSVEQCLRIFRLVAKSLAGRGWIDLLLVYLGWSCCQTFHFGVTMAQVTLGLDLGPNSIGWALIETVEHRIVASGVRVFPEGVDAFDTAKEKSRTQERRVKRGMRRQIARRARRKRELRKLLVCHQLLPREASEQAAVLSLDPYVLRAKGLDQALSAYEFGRVLLHLAARRGFLSNSKSDKAKAKETSDMLKEISELEKEIQGAGHRTLGEHLAALVAKAGERPASRVRSRHTRRDMLRKEFDLLWSAQKVHHPSLLTDELRRKLDEPKGDSTWWMGGAVFGQRNLYWPASMIGMCEYEPKERRAPKSDRVAQRYRILSEVNNLKYIDPDSGQVCSLDSDQRAVLLDHLSKSKEMAFDQIRKKLNFPQTVHFNLEAGERSKLKGHLVDYLMAKDSPFGKGWWELPEGRRDEVVRTLINPKSTDSAIKIAATGEWGLSAEGADQLLSVGLPEGYGNLSRKAMEKLVPHMEKGLLLMTDDGTPCALTMAGYLRPDQRAHKQLNELPEPPDLPNPVVRNTLHELRRLVNAIIREFGKPGCIHIELARSIKMGPDKRSEYNKAIRQREEERAKAAEAIRAEAPGSRLSRDLIDKYLLWEQQAGKCVYSGKSISLRHLLGGEVDVDHILPRWRSLDDSFANKVVCFRDMNREKGDQTPYEWLNGRLDDYEALKSRIRSLPFRKRARFTQEKIDTDEFAARQLVDTAYITRAAADYLRCLVDKPHDVLGGKGTYTAELRHLWGIETILSELSDSPAWAAQADLRPGEKNRADHRHHAIDAIVVALTDRRRLQELSKLYQFGETGAEILPWPGFRTSVVESVKPIRVSHRVQRRVTGALHEETIYGPVHEKTIRGEVVQRPGEFVVRKPLESLTQAMVEDIRDPTIKKLVLDRLAEFRVSSGKKSAGGIPKEVWAKPLLMKSGVPVKKVRLVKRDETIREIRPGAYVKPGSTHHLCIFEYTEKGKKKRDAVFVTMLEAVDRIKRREPVIRRRHPARPDAKFVMSLSRGELVVGLKGDANSLFVFSTAASTSGQMWFVRHTDARRSSDAATVSVKASTMPLGTRKVTVDPLGRVRWAND